MAQRAETLTSPQEANHQGATQPMNVRSPRGDTSHVRVSARPHAAASLARIGGLEPVVRLLCGRRLFELRQHAGTQGTGTGGVAPLVMLPKSVSD